MDVALKVNPPERSASKKGISNLQTVCKSASSTKSHEKLDLEPKKISRVSKGKGDEISEKDQEEVSKGPELSEEYWQELYEERLKQWKQQRPPSPVHDVKTIGVNTASAWQLEDEVKELRVSSSEFS